MGVGGVVGDVTMIGAGFVGAPEALAPYACNGGTDVGLGAESAAPPRALLSARRII